VMCASRARGTKDSSPKKRGSAAVQPSPRDDEVDLEFRSTRIEPVERIDTNEFKGGGEMTRKMAKWFENVGRPFKKQWKSEGRDWISATERATSRRDQYEDFDTLKLLQPCRPATFELDAEGELDARRERRAVKARDLEERLWAARHKPKSSGMSLSASSWQGPTRGHELHETLSNSVKQNFGKPRHAEGGRENDVDAGTRRREQALWLPVSENRFGRSSRPGPDWCGAVLFDRGEAGHSERLDEHAVGADAQRAKSSTTKEPSVPKDAGGSMALGLWKGFVGRSSRTKNRSSGRTRGMSMAVRGEAPVELAKALEKFSAQERRYQ